MDDQRRALCLENQGLADFMLRTKRELAEKPKGLSENQETIIYRAHRNVCNAKDPIRTLKDLSQIKGVGKWMLKLLQGYFDTGAGSSEQEVLTENCVVGNAKARKRYIPQRNSVAYAMLIALHRGTVKGQEFMRKQELIDAAEASGLSRVPIAPEKGKGNRGQFGSSPRDWYTGWNCMKTLIGKGLVVKSSCPAKYMLTEEGREVAKECIARSGLSDSLEISDCEETDHVQQSSRTSDQNFVSSSTPTEELPFADLRSREPINIPIETLEKFTRIGYSKEQVIAAFRDVSYTSPDEDASSLWLSVMCHLRETEVYNSHSEPKNKRKDSGISSGAQTCPVVVSELDIDGTQNMRLHSCDAQYTLRPCSSGPVHALRSCSSIPASGGTKRTANILSVPPLDFGEVFEDAYEVALILDDREQFATMGSRSRRIIDNICSEFKIKIQVRRLPVGDGIWIARHKYLGTEFVLDFIVERKKVDDLRSSIRDNRYRDQKLRLQRSGLKKLIYIVEGDPNTSDAAESIKTACFTTEILEGFDVLRTTGLGDTLRKYGFLTHAIYQFYKSWIIDDQNNDTVPCPPFDKFIERCQDLDKMTISDVFAIQLMQVPHVTEDIAVAVLDMYPTLLSLASAYSRLEGDVSAQEELLRKQSNNVVSATASKNIFRLVWND
ncbi:PREDICTED: crossover junction endonuclease MUS81 isoform X2 [Tarenaya hassleriana]|uniref:crossover junction endonuclease MUS81 isoform X2 n=1 Tax=Tarenaya hassleriana TaxID=28532 RepID=UPI00053C9FE9|nr:PREDICTED: crossover junction endonuclease MUS81 isoform X2 [Tarenaya hassleriana]